MELIDQSLVDARLRAKADLRIETLDVRAIVDELVQESSGDERKVRVEVAFDGKATMEGDRRLLYSTLSNLIHNAIKFTREGGRVIVRGREVESRLVVDIEDECGGLPEGKLEKLFDPFLQSGTDRSGFGLGLAICQTGGRGARGARFGFTTYPYGAGPQLGLAGRFRKARGTTRFTYSPTETSAQ